MKVATVDLRNRRKNLGDNIRGFLFDLDNTLIDREAAFRSFATCFYEQRLRDTTSMTRDDVVTKMVLWDEDGYVDRTAMFSRWANEWPEAGLDPERLVPWYRLEMKQHVQPDLDTNGLLAELNDIECRGASSLTEARPGSTSPVEQQVSINSRHSSSFLKRLAIRSPIRGFFATH